VNAAGPLVPARLTRLHLPAADYTLPLLEVKPEEKRRILSLLQILYGKARAEASYGEVERLMKVHFAHKTAEMIEDDRSFDPSDRFSERDVILITYGDLIVSKGKRPLRALMHFLDTFMRGAVNTVHVLPFYPYSSDRGFAVTDFEEVDPRLGGWEDIEELSQRYRMMFDGVFNHVSAKSRWFQRFLSGRPGYEEFFIAFGTKGAVSADHLKLILRPRTSELLTPFPTLNGPRFVWTTFSPDQVDLNFKSERVLQRVLDVLLLYVRKGADVVRLDAVTYIWHELGTRCAHLRETHALVQLFRAVLDVVAPQTALVTETNVPHADNLSYFGDGRNEAQMVYNFALPPLVLHTFHTGSVSRLSQWARELHPPSDTATFFNFLDSHDGIGLLGAENILTADEISALVVRAEKHGGFVSYRTKDGVEVPYELNITWWSAMNRDDDGEPQALKVERFLASRAIALVLQGVPGVYLPSAFGAKNDTSAVLAGAEKRSINRTTLDEASLLALLQDRASWVYAVASGLRRLAKRRIATRAFHPNSPQAVLDAGDAVFAVRRGARAGRVVALTNVTAREQSVTLDSAALGGAVRAWRDLLSSQRNTLKDGRLETTLPPYGVVWLALAD
jgi:glucosylglycerate phosphorylase